MAQGKKGVLLYCDLIHTVEKMDDKTAGLFFKHYLRYINDLNPETDNIIIELTFESVKQNLKRDLKKWEERAERSRSNGRLGGRPSNNPEKPSGLNNNPSEPRKPVIVTDTVTVTDKDINNIDFEKLLIFINQTLKRQFKTINQKAKTQFKARLKEGFTNTDIANAIKNAAKDKYHKENNYKFLTPEYFSRSRTLDLHAQKTDTSSLSISEQISHIKNKPTQNT